MSASAGFEPPEDVLLFRRKKDRPHPYGGLSVRLLSSRTLEDALRVGRACFPEPGDGRRLERIYRRVVAGDLIYPAGSRFGRLFPYFVYYKDGAAAAVSGLYKKEDEESEFWLGWFGVHPDFRRKGYGKAVVDHVKAVVGLLGGSGLQLHTGDDESNAATQAFYQELGFSMMGVRVVDGVRQRTYRVAVDGVGIVTPAKD